MDIQSSSRNIFKGLHLGKMLKTFSVSQLCNILCINSCYFSLHPRRTEETDKLGSRVLTAESDGTLGKSLLFGVFAMFSRGHRCAQVSQSKIRAKLNWTVYGYVMRKRIQSF